MKRRNLLYFIIIPIILIGLLLGLYFGKLWKPSLAAIILLIFLLIVAIVFCIYYFYTNYQELGKTNEKTTETKEVSFKTNSAWRTIKFLLIGFIADFLDTIGIGSYTITIVALKISKEKLNPKKLFGILSTGHAIPTFIEAIIFISTVKVDILTLVLLIVATVIGNVIGAYVVNKIKMSWIQIIIGVVLLIVSILILLSQKQVNVFTLNNTATSLEIWWKYLLAAIVFLVLGFLMAFGVGLYPPAMATIYLFGLDITAAFPIMTGAAAFAMPAGAFKFIRDRNYDTEISTKIAFGGSIGVFVSYIIFFVILQHLLGINKDNFVNILNWIVIVVIWYTAALFFYDYYKNKKNKTLKVTEDSTTT